MVLLNLCSNLYFPFLTYLANLKGLCNGLTTIPATPIITYPTTIIINTTLPATIATTTTSASASTSTTIRPVTVLCPTIPLACLTGGISPITGCACIDPRQTNLGFGMVNGVMTALPQQNQKQFPAQTLGLNNVQLGSTLLPQNQAYPYLMNGGALLYRDNGQQAGTAQRSGNLQQQELLNDSEVMVFASLGKKRRRKKRNSN